VEREATTGGLYVQLKRTPEGCEENLGSSDPSQGWRNQQFLSFGRHQAAGDDFAFSALNFRSLAKRFGSSALEQL
jgi:hypothetical protein